MVCFDSRSRLAITLRIWDTGTSAYAWSPAAPPIAMAVGWAPASAPCAAATAGLAARNSLTSSAITLPSGPVPATAERSSKPASLAMALARGLAGTCLPPLLLTALSRAGAGGAAEAEGAAGAAEEAGGGASPDAACAGEAASPPAARASAVRSAKAAMSSSSSHTTATGTPMSRSLAPSCTRILARKPESTASHSMLALSVSTSARMSPASIASPSLFFHADSVPWVIVGDSEGMPSTA
mmetsp:Transcript_5430/g.13588  ORF Transcript_5430/g.13588 Transcript_5430/m.13588 type:complete len:240 (-) Transcript_5430:104-823(-)